MIYAKLTDASDYRGIHPRLDRALALLTEDFLASVPTETELLEGEALRVTRFELTSSADEGRLYEHHSRFLDIFTLTSGCERVDLAPAESMRLVEHDGDYWGGVCEREQSVLLRPGSFLVLFPGDAHRPGMAAGAPECFSRVVFKVML